MFFTYVLFFLNLLYLNQAVSPTNTGEQNNAVGQIWEIGPEEVFRKTARETSLTDLHSTIQSGPDNSKDEDSMDDVAQSFLNLLAIEKQVKTAAGTLKLTKRDVNNDLLHKVSDDGQQFSVRSMNSDLYVTLRFTNLTKRPVNVWWRNYRGHRQHFRRLLPNESFDLTSYVTHPWEFTDAYNNESYGINNKDVFLPPASIAETQDRHNFNITKIYH